MRRFSRIRGEAGRLERDLRAARPEARADFLVPLTKHVGESRPGRPRSSSRLAFALALTTFVVGSFASFGGLGYAASGATSAVDVVKKAVKVQKQQSVKKNSAAQQQYPGAPTTPPQGAAQAAGAQGAAGAQANLPFTGISLLVTAVLGLALLTSGLALRRAEKKRN
jgi:hypothetical protein